jgi:type II secretory pathway pseudopilin PulG
VTLSILVLVVIIAILLWILWATLEPNTSRDLRKRTEWERKQQIKLDQQRYESWFKTSYSSIHNLSGGCVAWGMSGQCKYRFESSAKVVFKNHKTFKPYPCKKMMPSLIEDFSRDRESLNNIDDLICLEGKAEDKSDLYLAHNKVTNVYLLRNVYQLRGTTNQ